MSHGREGSMGDGEVRKRERNGREKWENSVQQAPKGCEK